MIIIVLVNLKETIPLILEKNPSNNFALERESLARNLTTSPNHRSRTDLWRAACLRVIAPPHKSRRGARDLSLCGAHRSRRAKRSVRLWCARYAWDVGGTLFDVCFVWFREGTEFCLELGMRIKSSLIGWLFIIVKQNDLCVIKWSVRSSNGKFDIKYCNFVIQISKKVYWKEKER